MVVYADLRWPARTGIGVIQEQLLARVPHGLQVENLRAKGAVGSPFSALAVSAALARTGTRSGVFWSPGFVPPARSRIAAVVTVHDLIHLRFYTRFHAAYYRWIFKHLYQRCAAIICVSNYTRQEFLDWSKIPPARVFTVHNGVSGMFSKSQGTAALPFPYVFYPGNRRSNKNLPRLLAAFAASRLPAAGIRLVLTGARDSALSEAAADLGVAEHLHFAGDVDEPALVDLYRNALVVVFVSLYEGFGLPIVEGMAAGTPVLTSNVSSMPEVAGDAAVLVNPLSVEEISHGLEQLAFDETERRRRIGLGLLRAAEFLWDTCASRTWGIVAAAANAGSC